MTTIKELPPLPERSQIPYLTIDAKAHVADIIRYAVTSRSLRAVWVPSLEGALLQLAQWLNQASFLEDMRNTMEDKLSSKATEDQANKTSEAAMTASASLPSEKEQDGTKRKTQLIRRLYKLFQERKDGRKHLLLTVAAPPAAVTAQELEFHVVPAAHGCSFEPSWFHLPFFQEEDGTTLGEGGTIISGLEGTYITIYCPVS